VPRQVTDIPPDQVGQVVQDFVDDGAPLVVATKQPNGKYTVGTPVPPIP